MTISSRTVIKSYFETGDRPTQAQFTDFIDSTLFYEDTTDFGRALISASAAGSARTLLGSGVVGDKMFTTITTASAQQNIGGGLVGRNIFEAITTASAQDQLGGGAVGKNLFEAITTASAQQKLDIAAATQSEVNDGINTKKFIVPNTLSGQPAFRAFISSAQSLVSQVLTKAQFDTETFDIGGYYDNTNYRYTPPAGTYQVNIGGYMTGNRTFDAFLYLYKNGVLYAQTLEANIPASAASAIYLSDTIELNGADYIEAFTEISLATSGACSLLSSNNGFSAHKIR
jgi:hypothetical protein